VLGIALFAERRRPRAAGCAYGADGRARLLEPPHRRQEHGPMTIAADYPFLDVFWTMIIFFLWVVWIWMMIVILTDVFRRHDIGGWSKAAWAC
jgi:hypothetical protein